MYERYVEDIVVAGAGKGAGDAGRGEGKKTRRSWSLPESKQPRGEAHLKVSVSLMSGGNSAPAEPMAQQALEVQGTRSEACSDGTAGSKNTKCRSAPKTALWDIWAGFQRNPPCRRVGKQNPYIDY